MRTLNVGHAIVYGRRKSNKHELALHVIRKMTFIFDALANNVVVAIQLSPLKK